MVIEKISVLANTNNNPTISITCPGCGHRGVFRTSGGDLVDNSNTRIYGQRYCPDDYCRTHIFFVYNTSIGSFYTYPSQTISFDKASIPSGVLQAFEESVICHANKCYIASGIMIRKTLEEICTDKVATGANLYQKLQALSQSIMIPQELKDAMQDLRLLGNDAAHIEAQTYNQVGKDEIEISIEFTKEILKAVYQYDGLLAKLRSLKRT
ncbi:uncharacterized protein DUF4145 [Chitinophaga niastensis]|uniref:Uncharacterized protein DUF4145 n=1 Tax=Chitinophaga niastensis TaxID=536980 RepID=A0A2P8H9A0_CHINA|nr:DUF4145 domain-containing protein [Chitinophaga niastensis]PSL42802.1 uncharacterized protein DUF4145 [Chitinophaga niastensis]